MIMYCVNKYTKKNVIGIHISAGEFGAEAMVIEKLVRILKEKGLSEITINKSYDFIVKEK